MYKDHFGLREAPFRITPHTGRFFTGAQRGAVLEALCYAVVHDEGIIRVTGEVGTGKTMLCRMLLDKLPAWIKTIYIANPSLAPTELLATLCEELEIPASTSGGTLKLIEARLIELHAAGQKVVAIIDEAHAMPRESLEQIRLLSNLETSTHKLLQIAVFAQPELNAMLAEPAMRSFRERITQSFELKPLEPTDIAAYLDFRLRSAGYKGPALFGDIHLALLSRASRGLTRRLNILADKTLLAAFADNTHTITPQHVRAAVTDAQFPVSDAARSRAILFVAAVILILVLLTSLWLYLTPSSGTRQIETLGRQTTPSDPQISAQSTLPSSPQSPPTSQSPALASAQGVLAAPAPALGPLASALLQASRKQIERIPDDQWFIQLRSTPAKDSAALEGFIGAARRYLQADLLQLYVARDTPGPQIGVIYGPFAEGAAAERTLEKLPPWVKSHGAYIRRYKSLR